MIKYTFGGLHLIDNNQEAVHFPYYIEHTLFYQLSLTECLKKIL